MEEEFQSALKKFWQTVLESQEWKIDHHQHCSQSSWGAASTVDVVQRLKKCFENLLKPAVLSRPVHFLDYSRRVSPKNSRWQCFIGGQGLPRLPEIFGFAGDCHGRQVQWQTRLVDPIFKERDQMVCSTSPGGIRPLVQTWIQEEQCGFSSGA